MKGRRGEQSCLFQRQFSLTKPKRGEKKRVKRETRRKTCSPKVGGGGGHIWYRALLECDWMLCCGGLFANLYLHKNSQRWKMPSEGAWELRGFGLGGRDGWERAFRSCLFLSACWTFFWERKGTSNGRSVRWVGGEGWNHPEWMERGKGWSWRGTSPGRGEWMTVKGRGGGGWGGGSDVSFMAWDVWILWHNRPHCEAIPSEIFPAILTLDPWPALFSSRIRASEAHATLRLIRHL